MDNCRSLEPYEVSDWMSLIIVQFVRRKYCNLHESSEERKKEIPEKSI